MENLDLIEKINDPSYIMNMKAFEYHELSKLTNHNERIVGFNISKLKATGIAKQMMKSYKIYHGSPQIELPKADLNKPLSLQNLIVNRRSRRNFKKEVPLTIQQISDILQLSYGATGEYTYQGETQLLRATPSGGALYPLEVYLVARNVETLDRGVYHYRVCQNSLEKVKTVDEEFFEYLEEKWYFPKGFQSIFVISGVWNRSFIKYMERAYRYLLMEAGIVGENITLISEAHKMNALMIGGWNDDEFAELLGLDGINEVPLLPICVGVCEDNE